MFCILVYDIPMDNNGTKRRNAIYNLCIKYGYHVQNSVFEFDTDFGTMSKIKHSIEKIIDPTCDSVRMYRLKKHTDENVSIIGKRENIESNDSCIIF